MIYGAGEKLFGYGEEPTKFYVVLSGEIKQVVRLTHELVRQWPVENNMVETDILQQSEDLAVDLSEDGLYGHLDILADRK